MLALLSRQIDVALIQAPWLEALVLSPLSTAEYTLSDFKVIEPSLEGIAGYPFPHLHSTLVYPLPAFVALSTVPSEV